jgi:hypothetical protein
MWFGDEAGTDGAPGLVTTCVVIGRGILLGHLVLIVLRRLVVVVGVAPCSGGITVHGGRVWAAASARVGLFVEVGVVADTGDLGKVLLIHPTVVIDVDGGCAFWVRTLGGELGLEWAVRASERPSSSWTVQGRLARTS